MADQAEKLRSMIESAKKRRGEKTKDFGKPSTLKFGDARIIAVSSGKGGVGKTNITLNLAIALSKMGKKVIVIDADLGLANIDVLIGLMPKYNLFHLLEGKRTIDDIIVEGPMGVKIVSGGSGIRELANLDESKLSALIDGLEILNARSDYILIDTGAGISDGVLGFIKASTDLFVVLSPDPASITDAYAVLKNVAGEQENIHVIVNRALSIKEAGEVYDKLARASNRFLGIELKNLGQVLEDPNVISAIRDQKPFLIKYPNTAASKSIELIAHVLINGESEIPKNGGFGTFIQRLFGKKD